MPVTPDDIIAVIKEAGVTADVSKIKGSTSLKAAGIDSLEMMNVFMGIEEKFRIRIPDQEIDRLDTIDQIVEYLQKNP